jgi:hypothetical protein
VLAIGLGGLCDEGELRVEGQRDVLYQATQELVADRTRGSFGNRTKQVPASDRASGWSVSANEATRYPASMLPRHARDRCSPDAGIAVDPRRHRA